MGKLEAHLRDRREAGHKLLVPYVTGGLTGWQEAVRAAAAHDRTLRVIPVLETARGVRDSVGLSAAQRHRNLAGRVRLRRGSDVPREFPVLLVDDVMTTGATLSEVAAVLKAAGAGRVLNWVVARTL